MFTIHNKAISPEISNDICYRFYWSFKSCFCRSYRLFVCWAAHSLPQSATHAIVESYSNFGEHSETSVRQLYNQLISVVVVLDNLALSTCYLKSETSVGQVYNQLISVVVVLDNLALTSKKIGTTEFFYQIIVFVKLKIKFSVKSSVWNMVVWPTLPDLYLNH